MKTVNGSGKPRYRLVTIITHSGQGGAQEALLCLARELRRRGYEVERWFLYGDGSAYSDDPSAQILLPRARPGFWGYLRIFVRLVKTLRSVRPDGVITFLPLACVLGQLGARLSKIGCRVASQRNPCWTYGRVMQVCDKLAGSLGVYSCNVANSRFVLESFTWYPRSYRRRLTVVYNGINWRSSALTQTETREKFALPAAVPIVVNVGRLSEQKNQALLIEMLPRLPRVHLAIVGDGELERPLKTQAAKLGVDDRVHFLGTVKRVCIPDVLRAADIFALPSRFEGQSNALIEAMHAGLPILASDIPPQAEVLRENGGEPAGRLLPLDDADSWVRAIDELIRDSNLRASFEAMAHKRAAAFDVESMGDGFESIIRDSLGLEPSRSRPVEKRETKPCRDQSGRLG